MGNYLQERVQSKSREEKEVDKKHFFSLSMSSYNQKTSSPDHHLIFLWPYDLTVHNFLEKNLQSIWTSLWIDPNLEIETCYLVYAHGTSQDFEKKINFPILASSFRDLRLNSDWNWGFGWGHGLVKCLSICIRFVPREKMRLCENRSSLMKPLASRPQLYYKQYEQKYWKWNVTADDS